MKTILDAITEHVKDKPDALAFQILSHPKKSITYQELGRRISQHANGLTKYCNTGDRVILLYNSSLEFIIAFLACLKAQVLPVPIYPPSGQKKRLFAQISKLDLILRQLKPTMLLCQPSIRTLLLSYKLKYKFSRIFSSTQKKNSTEFELFKYPIHSLKKIKASSSRILPTKQSDTAFLQYTSGSTGNPKGVKITHGNIINNAEKIARVLDGVENIITWLPLYHDMGLMTGLFLPLYRGIPGRILPPLDFLFAPDRWLKVISQYPNCASGGPNFAYEYCTKKINAQSTKFNLANWRVAYIGSEPNRYDTLQRFSEKFSDQGFQFNCFYPCYGLAESTVGVSGRNAGGENDDLMFLHINNDSLQSGKITIELEPTAYTQTLLSSGTWPKEDSVLIVDPNTNHVLTEHHIGEIWCQNDSIGDGYWDNPGSSEHYFRAFTDDKKGPYLRTGDLGFIHQQQLFITGRIKDLIIIRGKNFSAEDIEWTCRSCHPAIRPAGICAFGFSKHLEEKLGLLVEIKKGPHHTESIFKALRQQINLSYGLKVDTIALVRERSLHKTSSGKLQRSQCKHDFLTNTSNILAKQTANLEISTLCNTIEHASYFTDTY